MLKPAITPSCLQTILPRQVMSAGITACVVTSPAPTSSASAASMSRSMLSDESASVMGLKVTVKACSSVLVHDEIATPLIACLGESRTEVASPALLTSQGRRAHQRGGGCGGMQLHHRQPRGSRCGCGDRLALARRGAQAGFIADHARPGPERIAQRVPPITRVELGCARARGPL